jgi:hypothetical protein
MQFIPRGWFPGVNKDNSFTFSLKTVGRKFMPVVTNKNGDFTAEEVYEYKKADGSYETFYVNKRRSVLDVTSSRSEEFLCDECTPEAFAGNELTLRLKIVTLKGDVVYTEPYTVPVVAYLRNYYTDISEVASDEVKIESVSGGLHVEIAVPTNVRIVNLSGAVVFDSVVNASLDLQLPSGTYIVNGVKAIVK